jgi:uncharacterized damage-inducible protein DinB
MSLAWFERKFDFGFPVEHFDAILERLRGTPARLEEKVGVSVSIAPSSAAATSRSSPALPRRIPPEVLTRRPGESWSMQEHAGHLLDLDALHYARLDDYESGAEDLRSADLKNRKTWEARHNDRAIEEILAAFRRERARLVERFERWPRERLGQSALHPRLRQPMRVVDHAFFIAEHDDHHLAAIQALLVRFTPRPASEQ